MLVAAQPCVRDDLPAKELPVAKDCVRNSITEEPENRSVRTLAFGSWTNPPTRAALGDAINEAYSIGAVMPPEYSTDSWLKKVW